MRKYIKNVNVKNCFNVIVIGLLAIFAALLPFVFGTGTLVFYYETLPFFGNPEVITAATAIPFAKLLSFLPLNQSMLDMISNLLLYVCSFHSLIYFGIILLDLIFAVLLIITRWQWLRWIFRLCSIIAALLMIFLTLVYVLYIVGYVLIMLEGTFTINYLLNSFGILPITYCLVFTVILVPKQFKWFRKLY